MKFQRQNRDGKQDAERIQRQIGGWVGLCAAVQDILQHNTQVDRGNQEKAGVKHSLDIVKQQAPAPDAQGEQQVDDQADHKVAEKQNDKVNAPVRAPMLNQPKMGI